MSTPREATYEIYMRHRVFRESAVAAIDLEASSCIAVCAHPFKRDKARMVFQGP